MFLQRFVVRWSVPSPSIGNDIVTVDGLISWKLVHAFFSVVAIFQKILFNLLKGASTRVCPLYSQLFPPRRPEVKSNAQISMLEIKIRSAHHFLSADEKNEFFRCDQSPLFRRTHDSKKRRALKTRIKFTQITFNLFPLCLSMHLFNFIAIFKVVLQYLVVNAIFYSLVWSFRVSLRYV